jgi:hypothetical protein
VTLMMRRSQHSLHCWGPHIEQIFLEALNTIHASYLGFFIFILEFFWQSWKWGQELLLQALTRGTRRQRSSDAGLSPFCSQSVWRGFLRVFEGRTQTQHLHQSAMICLILL